MNREPNLFFFKAIFVAIQKLELDTSLDSSEFHDDYYNSLIDILSNGIPYHSNRDIRNIAHVFRAILQDHKLSDGNKRFAHLFLERYLARYGFTLSASHNSIFHFCMDSARVPLDENQIIEWIKSNSNCENDEYF